MPFPKSRSAFDQLYQVLVETVHAFVERGLNMTGEQIEIVSCKEGVDLNRFLRPIGGTLNFLWGRRVVFMANLLW